MSACGILQPGGSVEHRNEEAEATRVQRFTGSFPGIYLIEELGHAIRLLNK